MQKMLFIYNPRAGTGQIRASLSYILEEFAQHDMQITVHPTLGAGDAVKTVRKTATSISGLSAGTDHKYIVTAYVDKKWSAIDEKSAVTVKVK